MQGGRRIRWTADRRSVEMSGCWGRWTRVDRARAGCACLAPALCDAWHDTLFQPQPQPQPQRSLAIAVGARVAGLGSHTVSFAGLREECVARRAAARRIPTLPVHAPRSPSHRDRGCSSTPGNCAVQHSVQRALLPKGQTVGRLLSQPSLRRRLAVPPKRTICRLLFPVCEKGRAFGESDLPGCCC